VCLIVHGLVTVAYGVVLLVNPAGVAAYMGLAIVNGDGHAELLTMYVGMSGAVGVFMLVGAVNVRWLWPATLFLVVSMTGIAGGRLLSFLFLDGGAYTRNALLYDVPIVLLAWVAYRQRHRPVAA
jgi:hypothetical protein